MHRASNHEGCYIFDEKSERWRWVQRYTDPSTGKACRKAFTSKSRSELKAKVKQWQIDLEFGKVESTNKFTTKEWCEKWLSLIKPSIKIKTYDGYVQVLSAYIYPDIGDIKLKDLNLIKIQDFLNGLLVKLSPTTVIGVRRRLITILNMAIDQGLIHNNPAKLTKPPRMVRPKIIALNEDEVRRLLDEAKKGNYIYNGIKEKREPTSEIKYLMKNYYVAICIAVASSCRIGELFALSWDNIDFENNKITIEKSLSETASGINIGDPKTATSNRTIPLLPENFVLLREWRQEQAAYAKEWNGLFSNKHNLVFTNSWGRPVSLTNFYSRCWGRLVKEAHMPEGFTFHGLRHTGATLLLKHGVNIKVVSERLGHSSTSVTANIYQHSLPDMQDKALQELHKILIPKSIKKQKERKDKK